MELKPKSLTKCKLEKYQRRWLGGWSTNFITYLSMTVGRHLLQPLRPHPKINTLMSNGLHVINLYEVENVEKDGQPNMYINLEKPRLK
jgi:hypothetical protein